MEDAGKPNLVDYFPVLRLLDVQGIRRHMTVYFGKLFELFDHLIDQRLKIRKMGNSAGTGTKDMLDILPNICEDNNSKEIDRIYISHLSLVC